MQFGDKFSDEEVEELIKEADINNDGKIDYEEFSKMIMNEISQLIVVYIDEINKSFKAVTVLQYCKRKGSVSLLRMRFTMYVSKYRIINNHR